MTQAFDAGTLVAIVAALGIGFAGGMLAMVKRTPRPPRRCVACGVILPAQCVSGTGCKAPTAKHRVEVQIGRD